MPKWTDLKKQLAAKPAVDTTAGEERCRASWQTTQKQLDQSKEVSVPGRRFAEAEQGSPGPTGFRQEGSRDEGRGGTSRYGRSEEASCRPRQGPRPSRRLEETAGGQAGGGHDRGEEPARPVGGCAQRTRPGEEVGHSGCRPAEAEQGPRTASSRPRRNRLPMRRTPSQRN